MNLKASKGKSTFLLLLLAAQSSGASTPPGTDTSETPRKHQILYRAVPPQYREPLLRRLRLVEQLISEYGRAYDYREYTRGELESVLQRLKNKATVGGLSGSIVGSAPLPPPEAASGAPTNPSQAAANALTRALKDETIENLKIRVAHEKNPRMPALPVAPGTLSDREYSDDPVFPPPPVAPPSQNVARPGHPARSPLASSADGTP